MAKTSIIIFADPISTAVLSGLSGTTSAGSFTVNTEASIPLVTNALVGSISGLGVEAAGNITQPISLSAAMTTLGIVTQSSTGDVAPVVSTPSLLPFTENNASTRDLSVYVTDDGLSAVTYAIQGALPIGVSLDTNSGILSYSGTGGAATNSVTFSATDAVGSDTSGAFNVVIAGLTVMGLAASTMVAGEWKQLASNNLATVIGGQDGVSGSMNGFSNAGSWNPFRDAIEFVSSDHGYDPGQWYAHVRYEDATNNWVLVQPRPVLPSIGHAYDHNTVNPFNGDLYHTLYGAFTSSISLYRKRFAESTFSLVQNISWPGPEQNAHGTDWWTGPFNAGGGAGIHGCLMIYDRNVPSLAAFDPITETAFYFSPNPSPGQSGFTNDVVLKYSAIHNVAVYGGPNQQMWRIDENGVVTSMPNAPVSVGVNQAKWVTDPVTGNFLAISPGALQVHELDPTGSGSWSLRTTVPSVFGAPFASSGQFIVACEVPKYGVIAVWRQGPQQSNIMYLYKNSTAESWAIRSGLSGTVMSNRFDTELEVTRGTSDPQGTPFGDAGNVSWNQTQQASGNGCMQFTIGKNDAGNYGQWWQYLKDDETAFGTGDTVYIQYKAYFPAFYATHQFLASGQSGWKVSIISNASGSNQLYEIVHNNWLYRGYPQTYHRDTVGSSPPMDTLLSTPCNNSDLVQQNAIDRNIGVPPGDCLAARQKYGGLFSYGDVPLGPYPDPETGAFTYYPDEWITFLQKVTYGSFGTSTADTSYEMWAAREADTVYTKLYDKTVELGADTGDGLPDAIWMLPFDTLGLADPTRQDTYTLRDEIIVSTKWIPR